jgi:hypothetical protein
MAVSKNPIKPATPVGGTATIVGTLNVGSNSSQGVVTICNAAEPLFGASTGSLWLASVIIVNLDPTADKSSLSYWTDAGVRTYWTGFGWTTTSTTPTYAWEVGHVYTVELHQTATQWYLVLKEGTNVVMTTASAPVNFSATLSGSGAWYAALADNSASFTYKLFWDSVTYGG